MRSAKRDWKYGSLMVGRFYTPPAGPNKVGSRRWMQKKVSDAARVGLQNARCILPGQTNSEAANEASYLLGAAHVGGAASCAGRLRTECRIGCKTWALTAAIVPRPVASPLLRAGTRVEEGPCHAEIRLLRKLAPPVDGDGHRRGAGSVDPGRRRGVPRRRRAEARYRWHRARGPHERLRRRRDGLRGRRADRQNGRGLCRQEEGLRRIHGPGRE